MEVYPEIKVKKHLELEAQEELLLINKFQNKFIIGIPKESDPNEKRIPLTPTAVKTLIDIGYKVLIETGAGYYSGFYDEDYMEAGAEIVENKMEVFNRSNIIVKVAPFYRTDIKLLGSGKIIFSALNLTTQRKENFTLLKEKRTTAIAYEYYTDQYGFNPFLHSIGEIIGSTAVVIATEYLSNTNNGQGILLGSVTGVPPTNVIVLGSDISAIQAIKVALGLGANVKVFDNNFQGLIKINQIFGKHLFTSTLNRIYLERAMRESVVLINTLKRSPNEPFTITRDMVRLMKKRSIIIDLKIDSGSVIETSRPTTLEEPIYIEEDVIHYCVPNIASRVARTTSIALSNTLTPILKRFLEVGGLTHFIHESYAFKNSIYIFNGILVNQEISKLFSIKATSIDLFIDLH